MEIPIPELTDYSDGMALFWQSEPWKSLPIWEPELIRNETLGSLRAVFLFLISDCLDMLSRWVNAYTSCIGIPEAISPGYRLFLRDYFSHHLVNIRAELAQPWERLNQR